MWGYIVNWTNPDDGWTKERRKQLVNLRTKMKKQMAEVPYFTIIGYKKTKLPSDLYQYILKHRNLSDLSYEGNYVCTVFLLLRLSKV